MEFFFFLWRNINSRKNVSLNRPIPISKEFQERNKEERRGNLDSWHETNNSTIESWIMRHEVDKYELFGGNGETVGDSRDRSVGGRRNEARRARRRIAVVLLNGPCITG